MEKNEIVPNILILGKTGAGKTSLVQAVTHTGTVPDSAIGHAAPTTRGFQEYKTDAANFVDCEGMEPGQTVEQYFAFTNGEIVKRLDSNDPRKLIHVVWYCIDGSGGRVQSADAKIVRKFSDKVLLVVTKSELLRKDQVESLTGELLKLLPESRIIMVSSHQETGLGQLLDKTRTIAADSIACGEEELAEFRRRWEEYYGRMYAAWKRKTDEEADSFINWAAGRAAAIAIVPLPLADVGPLILNEAYMIYRLGAVYGYVVNKTIFAMIAGVAGGSIAGKVLASFLPALKIPIAAGITYGVGKAAKAFFESGMTLNKDELRKKFREEESKGKDREWKPIEEKEN